MKKMMIVLAIMTSGPITLWAGHPTVSKEVLSAFEKNFSSASEVKWTTGNNYYKVSFVFNGRYLAAYYDEGGRLYGITRHISSLDLPLLLLMNLKKDYSHYWITDLFELAKNSGTTYYITVEDANTKIILKSSDMNQWTLYKKIKKT
jgi:hypothetical protein